MHSPERQFRALTPASAEASAGRPDQEKKNESTNTPEVVAENTPIAETETGVSYLGVALEKSKAGNGQFVPKREQYEDFINDKDIALPLQRDIAVAFLNGEPMLLEGGTSLGKTTTVKKMAAELGWEIHYANLNGATDVEDLMGRYIPNPHKNKPEDPEYIFADGKVTSGLRQEEGKVKVIILDEFNASAPNILIRLHEVLDSLERGGDVILSEDASEAVSVNKERTKIIALMNPPGKGYFGREPLDPAQLRRWVYKKLPTELPEGTFSHSTDALFGAEPASQNVTPDMFLKAREETLTPEQLQEVPGMREVLEKYKEFHKAAKELLKNRKVAEDQPQPFTFDDRMEPRRVRDFVLRFYTGDINDTFQQALRYYYSNKLESEADRKKLGELIRLVEYKPKVAESKRKGVGRKEKEAKQTNAEIAIKLAGIKKELVGLDMPTDHKDILLGGDAGESAAPDFIKTSSSVLQEKLAARAAKYDIIAPALKIDVPEAFTQKHAEAMAEIFGKSNLEVLSMPSAEDLTDDFFSMMYPEAQSEYDSENELINKRGSWWKETASSDFTISEKEETEGKEKKKRSTWGELFVASIKSEAAQLQGSVLLTESIQKPNHTDGSQQYGSKEGADAKADTLLPIIREVFGKEANRFNLSWDKINSDLIPKVKTAIQTKFKESGLPELDFEVILTPSLAFNIQTTLNHPENSQTNTYEWSSTPLLKQDNTDSGHRLLVGRSVGGGAGYVRGHHRGNAWDDYGFRLSVVFKKY